MTEDKCWFCGRTEKQVIDDDISGIVNETLEEKKEILVKMDSAKWVNMPPVCCVCLMLLFEHLVNSKVVFDDELRERLSNV